MDRIEIRVGRRLVIRAAGRFAVLLITRLDRNAPIRVFWNAAPG